MDLTIRGVREPARPQNSDLMANSKSAAKRARQNPRRTLRNRSVITNLRSLAKRNAAAGGKRGNRALISALDKAAKRGVIHKNVANRRKARINKAAAKAPTASSTPPAPAYANSIQDEMRMSRRRQNGVASRSEKLSFAHDSCAFSRLSHGRLSDRHGHHRARRRERLALEFRSSRRDRPLQRDLFPAEI